MRTIKKLTIGLAVLAVSVMNAQAQLTDTRIGVDITLVTGEKKIQLFERDAYKLGHGKYSWENYKENYLSIKIPQGFDELSDLYIPNHSSPRPKWMETIQDVQLPRNASKLKYIQIIGTQVRQIEIPSGLNKLYSLRLGNNPLEIIRFPTGVHGRMVSLNTIDLKNTNIETLQLPEGLISLSQLNVSGCSRLHTIVFGTDTKEGVYVDLNGTELKRIVIPRRLSDKVHLARNYEKAYVDEVLYLEDLNPEIELSRRQGVLEVRWNYGNLYASENPDGHDWRLVGGVELSPLRIPAVLENKMFFQVKPQE